MSAPDTTKLREAVLRVILCRQATEAASEQYLAAKRLLESIAGEEMQAIRVNGEVFTLSFGNPYPLEIIDLDTPPEPEHKPHNPDGLTPEQIGVADGWRLLDEDEIDEEASPRGVYLKEIERRDSELGKWDETRWQGTTKEWTFRTHLPRDELAAKRKEGK